MDSLAKELHVYRFVPLENQSSAPPPSPVDEGDEPMFSDVFSFDEVNPQYRERPSVDLFRGKYDIGAEDDIGAEMELDEVGQDGAPFPLCDREIEVQSHQALPVAAQVTQVFWEKMAAIASEPQKFDRRALRRGVEGMGRGLVASFSENGETEKARRRFERSSPYGIVLDAIQERKEHRRASAQAYFNSHQW